MDSRLQRYIVFVSTVAALSIWIGNRLVPESTPAARGALLARAGGCIDCHGRPGSDLFADPGFECTGRQLDPTHPRFAGDCPDLLAYFEVVRLKRTFAARSGTPTRNRLLQGEQLARKYNCFQCHGELGQGGFPNKGALKGYIPGFFGDDFVALTRGGHPESVRAWIRRGVDGALLERPLEGPIAAFFIGRQAVRMPTFGTLADSEIRTLADYAIALNSLGPMDAQALRAYGRMTQRNRVDAGGNDCIADPTLCGS